MHNVADVLKKTLTPQEVARRYGDGTAYQEEIEKPRVRVTHDDMKKRRKTTRTKTR